MNVIIKELVEQLAKVLEDYVYIDEDMTLRDMTLRDINHRCIIRWDGDVNYSGWHNGSLKHEYFKFNGDTIVKIKTKEQAEEFKEIVIDYFTKEKDTL